MTTAILERLTGRAVCSLGLAMLCATAMVCMVLWTIRAEPASAVRVTPTGFGDGDSLSIWGTVGSAGIPDEKSKPKFKFSDARALVKASGTVWLRYNVTPGGSIDGFPGNGLTMAIRYRDNGSKARVDVQLRQMNIMTSNVTTIASFNSNNYGNPNNVQFREFDFCNADFDFLNNVYYVFVRLQATNASGKPELHGVQITDLFCE